MLVSHLLQSRSLRLGVEEGTEIIGQGMLLMLGTWTLVGYFRPILFRRIETTHVDSQNFMASSKPAAAMATREALTVGVAIAIDNVGPSFALGLIGPVGRSVFTLTILVGIFSILAVSQGQFFGDRCYAKIRKFDSPIFRPELISGLLFVIIAILPPDGGDLITELLK
jgi:putative Mn2+ efflux pump MntP